MSGQNHIKGRNKKAKKTKRSKRGPRDKAIKKSER
jgi:hypothetical protein